MTQPEVSHANQMKYAINLLCRWEGKRAFGAEELRTGADVEPGAMDALEDAGVVQMGVPGGLPDGITTKTPEGSHVWLLTEQAQAKLEEGGTDAVQGMI